MLLFIYHMLSVSLITLHLMSNFLWVFRSWSFGWYHSTHQTKSHTFHIGCAVFFLSFSLHTVAAYVHATLQPTSTPLFLSCCVRLNLCHMCCQWHPPLQLSLCPWGREAPEQSHATEYKWLQMEIAVFGLKWSLLFVPYYWLNSWFKFLQR